MNYEPVTRNQQPDFGFTLLEVMVALSIIAIVLVSVYKMQAQTISMNLAGKVLCNRAPAGPIKNS